MQLITAVVWYPGCKESDVRTTEDGLIADLRHQNSIADYIAKGSIKCMDKLGVLLVQITGSGRTPPSCLQIRKTQYIEINLDGILNLVICEARI